MNKQKVLIVDDEEAIRHALKRLLRPLDVEMLTASDGEARIIGAGEVILVEDINGKGHLSQAVNNQVRRSIFVPVD